MRDTLEIIYFVSGVVVAIAACIGLYQLIITKQTAVINAKRASFTLAAEQCVFYLNNVIPLQDKFDSSAEKVGLFPCKNTKVERIGNSIHISIQRDKERSDKFIKVLAEFIAAMNAVEGFSAYITNGVAADMPAFGCVGKTFCNAIERWLPELCLFTDNGHYSNIIKLYGMWSSRIEKQRLQQERIILDNKVNEIIDFKIKSIGE